MVLGDLDHAVERRQQNDAVEAPLGSEAHRDAAAEAASEHENSLVFPRKSVVPSERVALERLLGRLACAASVAAVVDQQPGEIASPPAQLIEHPRYFFGVATEVDDEW